MALEPIVLAATLVAPPTGAGLRFIDVGQGSALLMLGAEGHAVLVDSGPRAAPMAVTPRARRARGRACRPVIHTHLAPIMSSASRV
jgi:beta-lactamase superfamily II metal-dependent hydrolase